MDLVQATQESHVKPASITLDLNDLDLESLASLEGSALDMVIKELADMDGIPSAEHSSHSSYSTHGTALWF